MIRRVCTTRQEGHSLGTGLQRRLYVCVVIFSQQASDSKPRSPQMPDVEVQIRGASFRTSMSNLHLELTKHDPFWGLVDNTLRFVKVPSCLFHLCPSPCNVQYLEVHVRALPTQSARLGLHAKQCA